MNDKELEELLRQTGAGIRSRVAQHESGAERKAFARDSIRLAVNKGMEPVPSKRRILSFQSPFRIVVAGLGALSLYALTLVSNVQTPDRTQQALVGGGNDLSELSSAYNSLTLAMSEESDGSQSSGESDSIELNILETDGLFGSTEYVSFEVDSPGLLSDEEEEYDDELETYVES